MIGEDLFSSFLQLNPPVLVRTNENLSVADLAALRRNCGNVTGGSASQLNSSAPLTSLTARKLHDAKSAAREVSRSGDVPPRSHTTEMLGHCESSSMTTQQQTKPVNTVKGKYFSGAVSTHTADQSLCGATGSAPASPSAVVAAAAQRSAVPTTPLGGYFTSGDGLSSPTVTATAAATSSGDENISLNLPYLMRHIQNTGALLDTLFPLRLSANGTSSTASRSNNGADITPITTADGVEEAESPLTLVAVRTVSTVPASREAVMMLHSALQTRLEARRARPTGLCGIRRSIYADLFSELVRQVTIEEPARGLLLARVRENEEHALRVHAALLREGENFAAGKLLQDTRSMEVLRERLTQLRHEKTQLEVRRHDLEEARQELVRRFEEQRTTRRAQQQDELNYLRRANQQLSLRLKMETERASAGSGGATTGTVGIPGGSRADDGATAAAVSAPVAAS